MDKGIRRVLYALLISVPVFRCESNNAAQVSMPLPGMPFWSYRHADWLMSWTRSRQLGFENPLALSMLTPSFIEPISLLRRSSRYADLCSRNETDAT
jgi:hypothetical protein